MLVLAVAEPRGLLASVRAIRTNGEAFEPFGPRERAKREVLLLPSPPGRRPGRAWLVFLSLPDTAPESFKLLAVWTTLDHSSVVQGGTARAVKREARRR